MQGDREAGTARSPLLATPRSPARLSNPGALFPSAHRRRKHQCDGRRGHHHRGFEAGLFFALTFTVMVVLSELRPSDIVRVMLCLPGLSFDV